MERNLYISRTVLVNLHEPPYRFYRHADRRGDDAGSENGVDCSAGEVVLQDVAVALVGGVRRHTESPGCKTRSSHEQQEQSVSDDRDATGLSDG